MEVMLRRTNREGDPGLQFRLALVVLWFARQGIAIAPGLSTI